MKWRVAVAWMPHWMVLEVLRFRGAGCIVSIGPLRLNFYRGEAR